MVQNLWLSSHQRWPKFNTEYQTPEDGLPLSKDISSCKRLSELILTLSWSNFSKETANYAFYSKSFWKSIEICSCIQFQYIRLYKYVWLPVKGLRPKNYFHSLRYFPEKRCNYTASLFVIKWFTNRAPNIWILHNLVLHFILSRKTWTQGLDFILDGLIWKDHYPMGNLLEKLISTPA